MRITVLALLLSAPAAALAQTPRDIAAQLWPAGAPVSSNHAPAPAASHPAGATAADLARLTWGNSLPGSRLRAPANGTSYVSAFNGAAILALRATPAQAVADQPFLVGAR